MNISFSFLCLVFSSLFHLLTDFKWYLVLLNNICRRDINIYIYKSGTKNYVNNFSISYIYCSHRTPVRLHLFLCDESSYWLVQPRRSSMDEMINELKPTFFCWSLPLHILLSLSLYFWIFGAFCHHMDDERECMGWKCLSHQT